VSQATGISIDAVRGLPTAAKLNAAGLVLAAAGMFVEIATGSTLYPSIAGPIVLIVAAIVVAFGPARTAPWAGLVVPLVLGIGAIGAATITGNNLVSQLTDFGKPGIFAGSVMHVVGLVVAIVGGLMMVTNRREPAAA
jgi:hypothetical protein